MPELRREPITGRWVIVDTDHPKHPKDFVVDRPIKKGGLCPFCVGNESMTPTEIDAHREGATPPNTPGWLTRVIPNKFPALRIEGELDKRGLGLFDLSNGIGAHEVIIETPDHQKEIPDLLDHEVERVMWMYRNRSVDLRGDSRLRYILIFKNYGRSAGASLEHAHSQLIALPIIPKRVNEELVGSSQYYEYRDRCVFCDILQQELHDRDRLVVQNKHYVAFAPYVSSFAFETWILPRTHRSDFCHIEPEEVIDLARILRETLLRLRLALGDPPYNLILHSGPIEKEERPDYHWHIEITPKLTGLAGFEWGSGFYIASTPPELAAGYLRNVQLVASAG